MKISYTILAYNEVIELERLFKQLIQYKTKEDEILVLLDSSKYITQEMLKLLLSFSTNDANFSIYKNPLNNDFANQKNFISKKATGDYIISVDADEYFHSYFLENVHQILETNKDVDAILMPRINIVEGMTEEDIRKYHWEVNDKSWINFPDVQNRIYKNKPEIHWENKVHEQLRGYLTISRLPKRIEYCLMHIKTIKKQRSQNEFYSNIIKS